MQGFVGLVQVPAASMEVSVRNCVTGEVQSTPETCTACQPSTYSFNANETSCHACLTNANCTGGAILVPELQYWHSAPDSDFILQCPNNHACLGDRGALLSCKNASHVAASGQQPVSVVCFGQAFLSFLFFCNFFFLPSSSWSR